MASSSGKVLFWAPRVLCGLYAAFVSLFALDVFDNSRSLWATIGALSVHLIPTVAILLVLLLAWRWEWIGALVFAALGTAYTALTWRQHPDWAAIIAGPLFLVALLFLMNWIQRLQTHSAR